MKKFLLSGSLFVVFGFYILMTTTRSLTLAVNPGGSGAAGSGSASNTGTGSGDSAATPTKTNRTSSTKPAATAPAPTPVSVPASTPAPTPIPVPVSQGQSKNGTWTGPATDAYYGTVQVQAIVSGGKLTDVRFLQYPSDRQTSRYINGQAMPLLTQEAVQAQSAQVNAVSGATQTSQAFMQSLAAALTQAKA